MLKRDWIYNLVDSENLRGCPPISIQLWQGKELHGIDYEVYLPTAVPPKCRISTHTEDTIICYEWLTLTLTLIPTQRKRDITITRVSNK